MKHFFIFLFFIFSLKVVSQNQPKKQDSLSIAFSIPKITVAQQQQVESVLKNDPLFLYKGYCSEHNVFILSASKQHYSENLILINDIKQKTALFTIRLKEAAPEGILPFCKDFAVNPDAQNSLKPKQ